MPQPADGAQQRGVEDSKHEIGKPLARRVGLPSAALGEPRREVSFEGVRAELPEGLRAPAAELPAGVEAAEPEEEQGAVTAVLVVHGMGQQVPFQTLDQVETGLRRLEAEKTAVPVAKQPRSNARAVLLGDKVFERLEMKLTGAHGPAWVHLYEAYWAPLTEGKVTLRDVMGFLLDGGWNGLAKSRESFWRWMFGRRVDFGRQRTAFKLFLGLGVIGVLVLINALVTAVAAVLVASRSSAGWLSPALLSDLTVVIVGLVALLLIFAGLAWKTRWMGFFYLAIASVLASGLALLVLLAWHRLSGTTPWPHPPPGLWWKVLFAVFWLGLLRITLFVRTLLIQYLGDVAAYVAPQKLDRFNALRSEIKSTVTGTAEAIYGALSADGRRFEYESVAVVAHSLGSVVAYDALNALINLDHLKGDRLRVVPRTRLLLTFGSPLDKTAFLFANQSKKTTESREALAAAVQPLIQTYELREFRWVNVFSRKDIISGNLQFYDDAKNPLSKGRLVDNREDPDAATPLYAHVQYWENDLVFRELQAALS
ncbi:MAG TPA: hypothetical protein VOA87_05360 [Thermoanaerobaculia bacterium]|nr:hypothetical protein [Thermoanaerobaculia bacterium]